MGMGQERVAGCDWRKGKGKFDIILFPLKHIRNN